MCLNRARKLMIRQGFLKLSWAIVSVLSVSLPAGARGFHYGAVDDPGLLACDEIAWTGKTDQARSCYVSLLSGSTEPVVQAEAYWALGDLKSANNLFKLAVERSPDDAGTRARWGELFVETYQDQEAMGLFGEALERDPEHAYSMVGAAALLAKSFEAEAGEFLDKLPNDAPVGARVRAHLLAAKMALEASAPGEARESLDEAGDLAEGTDIPQLEIYALRASADFLEGVAESEWITRALDENPSWGEIYATVGYFSWITRRYREAVELYDKAIAIQPDLWEAHLELGINLLRDNEVTRARHHIETAYQGDPYNPKTVNTLRLLDTFDDYHVLTVPEKPEAGELPTLILRLHEDESGVIQKYVRDLAARSLDEFSARYQFSATEPVIIELYPNHEDFVVRTTGMPGLGILGATFGYLLAMDSPNGNPETDYHWGTTLWHEMAHVITLEATEHLVPRWYSEGISVYEEWRSGPVPGIRIPLSVYQAMSEDKFLPIAELDGGFVRPTYQGQVIVSYIQAGLICEFIDREYGDGKLVDLLDEYSRGVKTTDAIETVLELSPDSFDEKFSEFVDLELGSLVSAIPGWMELQAQVHESMADEGWNDVIEAAESAIDIFPEYVEADSPYVALGKALDETGDEPGSTSALETFWRKGGYTPSVLKELVRRYGEQGRIAESIDVLESLNFITPFDADLHADLGDALLMEGRAEEALAEYEVLLAMEPHDLAAVHFQLASAYFQLEDFDDTRNHLLKALDIAPRYRDAQKLLLKLADARN
jgi:tetratricopeptide (TPR) repeat protein